MSESVKLDQESLKYALKELIIFECDKEDELTINDIDDNEALIGSDSAIGLDSLDTLQLSLAIKNTYKVRIEGVKEGRKAFSSVNNMAAYILEKSS